MSYSHEAAPVVPLGALSSHCARSPRRRVLAAARPLRTRPELAALLLLAGVLNLWALSRNGWANDYYSAAVRSMASSWHNFLFASLDPSGVMTVDKPPLALWVQALSVRIFGFHSLSILVPQALMGMATVGLVYDLARRPFGRLGGAVAGLALALTPITVAVSRHNNPDALLALCCVAALWCAVRAIERAPEGRGTRWLALSGVCVGLGFETKMGVALTVVPGIAAAWLWLAPAARGRLHALRQLLAGGLAMVVVAGAWPALVELTPAADRPWVSGTSDNRVLSLIFGYNGLGRVDGQSGGPAGMTSGTFGGAAGPLRLLNSALGGQDGWLLGFALLAALTILFRTRLRRREERTGWLLVVGGAFLTIALLFSFASGIFHPYYVSLLAPFTALLVGAGAEQLLSPRRGARLAAPAAVLAGVGCELLVLGDYPGQLRWLVPLLIAVGLPAAAVLALRRGRAVRLLALGSALLTLMIGPGVWAFDTLGHATSGTFPEGGPASLAGFGGPGRFGAVRGSRGAGGFAPPALLAQGGGPAGAGGPANGSAGQPPLPAGGGGGAGGFALTAGGGSGPGAGTAGPGGFGGARGAGGPGGFGAESLSSEVLAYVKAHGGGTIALASQSGAASAILSRNASVAGIGGFSGRESSVSVKWLAAKVKAGAIRWVLDQEIGVSAAASPRGFGGALPGDRRAGSRVALQAVAKACRAVSVGSSSSGSGASMGTLYDCRGRAAQLALL